MILSMKQYLLFIMNNSFIYKQKITSKMSSPGRKYWPTFDSVMETISGIVVPAGVVVVVTK